FRRVASRACARCAFAPRTWRRCCARWTRRTKASRTTHHPDEQRTGHPCRRPDATIPADINGEGQRARRIGNADVSRRAADGTDFGRGGGSGHPAHAELPGEVPRPEVAPLLL